MSDLSDRYRGVLERTNRLQVLEDVVRAQLVASKRRQLLAGVDSHGVTFAPLAASTRKNKRRGPGGPLVADGPSSRLITEYTVKVDASPARLTISAGWPFLPFVQYLKSGTRRMPARDPTGILDDDRRFVLSKTSEHLWTRSTS